MIRKEPLLKSHDWFIQEVNRNKGFIKNHYRRKSQKAKTREKKRKKDLDPSTNYVLQTIIIAVSMQKIYSALPQAMIFLKKQFKKKGA